MSRIVAGRGTAAVVIALTAAFAFGAIDQYLGALYSLFLTQLSGISAPWLLVPFLAGAWQAGPRRAALVGLAATWLAVLGYVVMIISPVEGTHLGPRPAGMAGHPGTWVQLSPHLFLTVLASQWLWFAAGLVTGPCYGWLGHRWRARRSLAAALCAALPVLIEPGAHWVAGRWLRFPGPISGPATIAEALAGLVLTGAVAAAMVRAQAARSP